MGADNPADPDDVAVIARSDVAPFVGSSYANEQVDEVHTAAAATTEWTKRERLYKEAQAIAEATKPNVKGVSEVGAVSRLYEVRRDDAKGLSRHRTG